MTDLLELISSLLDGMVFIALALVLGGIGFALVVLRVFRDKGPSLRIRVQRVLGLTLAGAVCLIVFRVLQLVIKPLSLFETMGESAFLPFAQTQVFKHGIISVLLALGLLGALIFVKRRAGLWSRWLLVLGVAIGFMVNEGWLSHAASRLDGAAFLMFVTVVHILGGMVWAGGIIHLLFLWQFLCREDPDFWPKLVSRFLPIGIVCVVIIVISGGYLTWQYVRGWVGLIGTGYGNMVAVKIILFSCVLFLAILNFFAVRGWHCLRDVKVIQQRVSAYIEVEIILAVALLFTAASLTGFPPSIDVLDKAASPTEMWTMYNPKLPRLVGPELVLIDAPELTDLRTGQIGKKEDISWDRFNHNFSGILVIVIGLIALLDRYGGFRWARYWPLVFIGFSVLIFFFANPDHWPIGSIGFIESCQETEVVQHWLAAVVVFGLGWFEWRARDERTGRKQLQFMFPVLCIVGGIILLMHSHAIDELKKEFLIQSTHVSIGILSIFLGCGRWLEIRLAAPYGRIAGIISISAMILVGVILLFYIEPNFKKL